MLHVRFMESLILYGNLSILRDVLKATNLLSPSFR